MTATRSVRLAAASLAADRITLCEVGSHRVGVIRTSAGELHALADRCPHRGAPICSYGELVAAVSSYEAGAANGTAAEASLLRCPWHKWDYDPATGVCPAAPKYRLKRYHVWEDGGDVIVSLDPRPARDGSPARA